MVNPLLRFCALVSAMTLAACFPSFEVGSADGGAHGRDATTDTRARTDGHGTDVGPGKDATRDSSTGHDTGVHPADARPDTAQEHDAGGDGAMPVDAGHDAGPVLLAGMNTFPADVNSDDNGPGAAEAFLCTGLQSGTVDTLGVYIDATSSATSVSLGFYAGNMSMPGALLASATISMPAGGWAPQWYSATATPSGAQVVMNATYWIAILPPVDAGGDVYFVDTSNGQLSVSSTSNALSSLPPVAGYGGTPYANSPIAAYAAGH